MAGNHSGKVLFCCSYEMNVNVSGDVFRVSAKMSVSFVTANWITLSSVEQQLPRTLASSKFNGIRANEIVIMCSWECLLGSFIHNITTCFGACEFAEYQTISYPVLRKQ